jgi:D-3-phosphoglycerate dehydrogenase
MESLYTNTRLNQALSMPKVAVTDHTFPSLDIESRMLEPLGCTISVGQCRQPAELIEFLRGADYIITQFAPLNADVISSLSDAKLIVRYGIGVDNVDLAAAAKKGIPVCNVPDYCIDEVADHALALILAATRQVVANAQHVKCGKWGLPVPLQAMRSLKSMTVGVVGFGRIGKEVAARLSPFKCRLAVYDPIVADADIAAAGYESMRLDELLHSCDLVTLHCPAVEATHHLIDARAISKLKDGAILVNVARGAVVCTQSLIQGLESGKISFAALDVVEKEPISPDHPLLPLENVLITSHIASTSEAAVANLRREVASLVAQAVQGQPIRNVVNGVSEIPSWAGSH